MSNILNPTRHESRVQFMKSNLSTYIKPRQADSNPMTDPSQMEGTMDMMKKNVMMIVPQTLIMSWISFFFSGFVLTRLPFPVTLRFKSMLQRGIETTDMDVRWVSSISWYFLLLFGLNSVYTLIMKDSSHATANQMDMMQMQGNTMAQPGEIKKVLQTICLIEFNDA